MLGGGGEVEVAIRRLELFPGGGGVLYNSKWKWLVFFSAFLSVSITPTSGFWPREPRRTPTNPEDLSQELLDSQGGEIGRCTSQVSNTLFNQGLRVVAASMKSRLAEGIPEFGIPAMDPLKLSDIHRNLSKYPAETNITLTNLKVYDLTSYSNSNWFLDVNTRILDMALIIPGITVQGDYFLMPPRTKGNITIRLEGVTIKSKVKLKIVDTRKYPKSIPIKTDRVVSDLQFTKVRIWMDDLLPKEGNDQLNYAFRMFIEKYSAMLYDEFKPIVKTDVEYITGNITDSILSSAIFHTRLPSTGLIPGINLSTVTNIYDRLRNALQLPSSVTRSAPYRSIISLLDTAFRSCRSYTELTDSITQPFINLLGMLHQRK